jgi:hypothetical protein
LSGGVEVELADFLSEELPVKSETFASDLRLIVSDCQKALAELIGLVTVNGAGDGVVKVRAETFVSLGVSEMSESCVARIEKGEGMGGLI